MSRPERAERKKPSRRAQRRADGETVHGDAYGLEAQQARDAALEEGLPQVVDHGTERTYVRDGSDARRRGQKGVHQGIEVTSDSETKDIIVVPTHAKRRKGKFFVS